MHNRFFIEEKIDNCLGKEIILESITAHIKAFRKKIGEPLLLYDGLGNVYSSKIIKISKKNIGVELLSVKRYSENGIKIFLFLPLITSHIMDQLIARVCELEINGIFPVIAERSVNLKNEKEIRSKLTKWDKIAKGSMVIAGKNFSTAINKPSILTDAFKFAENFDSKLIASPSVNYFLKDYLQTFNFKRNNISIGIFIGPEGDFSSKELRLSREYGFTPVKLSHYIMSTFVASIYFVSNLICFAFSDHNNK